MALPLLAQDAAASTSTNSGAPVTAVALAQLQDQLRATQAALENASKNNSEMLLARIQALEQTIATQHSDDLESARKTQQYTLLFCGILGGAGLTILLLMAYFQWRALAHLVEISTKQAAALPLTNGGATVTTATISQMAAPGRLGMENSNARLLGSVERLERRIAEMERSARAQLPVVETPPARPVVPATNGNGNGQNHPVAEKPSQAAKPAAPATDRDECVANLIAEGQSLLNNNESARALECFETALGLEPGHSDALVKKGTALERLGQFDEALACYDRSIQAGATTIAYLQKGGLLNRMARYDEALKCYEFALHAQEKKP